MTESSGTAGVVRMEHVALVVSDLTRALHFYGEGLGFRRVGQIEVGKEAGLIYQLVGDVRMKAIILTRDATTIELVQWALPGVRPQSARPANEAGLAQIAVTVADIDVALAALTDLGGISLPGTRTRLDMAEVVLMRDPDGTIVELIQMND